MAWIEFTPSYAAIFQERNLDTASALLRWSGILVNRHRDRQVEQVRFPEEAARASDGFYVKKQHRVTWRERLRNAWRGFGWRSTSVREAALLQAAKAAGVGCPDLVAFGEDGNRAFVLVRAASGMTELPRALTSLDPAKLSALAEALGHALARLHDAGFEHPDLFAKHVLVAPTYGSYRISFLDWARAGRRRSIPWRIRCRDLAVLDATLHQALASDRLRLRCLRAYMSATTLDATPWKRLASRVRHLAQRLQKRRSVREIAQPLPALGDQQFVPLCDGRLLVVRSHLDSLNGEPPDWWTHLVETDPLVDDFALTDFSATRETKLALQTWPRSHAAWSIPDLAHTLFRLQRFGVRAPRLLAVGASARQVFVLSEAPLTAPFAESFAKAPERVRRRMLVDAGKMIRQIHEAGYGLPASEAWQHLLGASVHSETIALLRVDRLVRTHSRWQDIAPRELGRQRFRLTPYEQRCFLLGYLGGQRRRRTKTLVLKERQLAA